MTTSSRLDRRVVVVFRTDWLPASETFIRNQVDALSRWSAVQVGIGRVESVLARSTDLLVMPNAPYNGVRRRLLTVHRRNRRLRKLLAGLRPDVVHAHFGTNAVLVTPTLRRLRVPLIVTFHGADATSVVNEASIWGSLYRRRLQEVFEYSSAILTVSAPLRDRLLELGAPSEKVLVHNIGVPLVKSAESERKGILFVGRLTPKKGVDLLLEAAAILHSTGQLAPITVVGDGPLRVELSAMARRIGVEVAFTGALHPDRVRRLMATAQVLCVPSRTSSSGETEGTPTVVIEAGAQSTPVVGTRHGGIPGAVKHGVTGLLVPENSPSELASALRRVLSDNSMARAMGVAGRQWVEQHFDVVRQSALLEDIYDSARSGQREW